MNIFNNSIFFSYYKNNCKLSLNNININKLRPYMLSEEGDELKKTKKI